MPSPVSPPSTLKILFGGSAISAGFFLLRSFHPFNLNTGRFLILFLILYSAFLFFSQTFKTGRRGDLALILLFAALFRACLFSLQPSLSDDIYRYAWDGKVQEAGVNPYLHSPDSTILSLFRDPEDDRINHSHLTTIYPPASQAAFRLGRLLSPGWKGQKAVFLLSEFLLILILLLLLKALNQPLTLIGWYAWNPAAVMEFSGSGHLDSWMMALMFAGFLFIVLRKNFLGGAFLGSAIMAKAAPAVLIPWLWKRTSWKLWLGLGLAAAAWFFSYFPWGNWPGWAAFSGPLAFSGHWRFNGSLFPLLESVLPFPHVVKGFFAGLILYASWRAGVKGRSLFSSAAGLIVMVLLLSPVVHPWYVVWLIPFTCFLPWKVLWVWPAAAAFSYMVLPGYWENGVWFLHPGWRTLEYGLVFGSLAWDGLSASRKLAPAERDPLPRKEILHTAIIIPAHNEEKALPFVIQEIPDGCADQIIVVDNASTDATAETARQLGAEVIAEPIPGYGRAVLAGMTRLNPSVDTVVVLDGDHADFPEDLPKLLDPIKKGEADFVIGSRRDGAQAKSLLPHQRFGNTLTCFLIRLFFGFQYTDMGPFRAIRRSALESLRMKDKNFGWNVEMQVKALQKGFRVREASVRYRPRIGVSKISGTVKGSVMAGVIILYSIVRYGFWDRGEAGG